MPTISDLVGPVGPVEALLDEPSTTTLRAAVVFAHPHPQYGGTLHTKAVYQGAKALARIGCAVLRFNFRGAGRSAGTFSGGRGEMDDFRSALDNWAPRCPGALLWTAGLSVGAWVGLEAGAQDDRVRALIGLAPPVATTVYGQAYSFEHTLASTKPKFFVHGEGDGVCPVEAMWAF